MFCSVIHWGGSDVCRCKVRSFFKCSQYFFLFLMDNHFHTPVSVRFPFFYVVITPQNGVFNNFNSLKVYSYDVVITPQNGVFNNFNSLKVYSHDVVITPQNGVFNNIMTTIEGIQSCNNPSKWGLQQQETLVTKESSGCDNPS